MTTTVMDELQRQIDVLIAKGYPAAAGLSVDDFWGQIEGLRSVAGTLTTNPLDERENNIAFTLVIKSEWISAEFMMAQVHREGKQGHIAMAPVSPLDFKTINSVPLPKGNAYLLVDIDRGTDTLNVTPESALRLIQARERSPLTIDEGLAIMTHHPDFLVKNNCFSLLASRRNDQRVPAIWIDGKKRPKLGWCWDRNPHTWLGSASCKTRMGSTSSLQTNGDREPVEGQATF